MADDSSPKPGEPLDQKTLQQLLNEANADKEAMRKEFEGDNSDDKTVTESNARKRIAELGVDAYNTLKHCVKYGEKDDALKLNAAKYVLDVMLGKKKLDSTTDDAMAALIESLKPKEESETTSG